MKMVCFNDYRSEFVVRVLAVLQFLLQGANIAGAVLSLLAAWSDKGDSSNSPDGHHCECVLKTKPYSCDLIESDGGGALALWDLLFGISCLWVGALNLLAVLKDFRYGTSRMINSLLFMLSGSTYIGLGDHYDRDLLTLLGYISCSLSLLLLFSVPMCGRVKPLEQDEESRLTDNDEFAHANGVFSRLND